MLKNNHGFLEYTIEDKGLLQEVSANKELDDEVSEQSVRSETSNWYWKQF